MKQPFFLLRLILFLLVAASFNVGHAKNSSYYAFEVDGICYDIIDGNCLTVMNVYNDYCVEHDGVVNIPDSVNGMPVTAISNRAFSYWDGMSQSWKGESCIKSVTIGNAVTTIGKKAFYGCTNLTSVNLGNSVTTIDDYAFYGCTSLANITFANSVASISGSAFYYTAWYNSQPDGVVYAGPVAYRYKGTMPSGTSITLKEGTLGITSGAFNGCTGLTSVNLPNSVTSIGSSAFYGCTSLSSITIPNSVTSIGESAFDGTTWFGYQQDAMVYAGKVAYRYRGFDTSITLENGTLGIAGGAFRGCTNLTNVTIPNTVTSIGNSAFYNCKGLTSVNLGNSVASIGDKAFSYCSGLTSVTIPNSVTTIGAKAFYYCSELKNLSIGSSVKKIESQAFYWSPIEAVYITDLSAWCKIDFSFFDDDGWLQSGGSPLGFYEPARLFLNQEEVINLVIPEDIVAIPWGAFGNCQSLRTVDTGPNVKIIYGYAFRDCPNLEEITIGENVQDCLSVAGILYEETPDHYYPSSRILPPFPEHVNRLIVKSKSCVSLGNQNSPFNMSGGSSFDEIVIDEGVEVMPDDIWSSSPKSLYYNAINGATQPAGNFGLPYWYYGVGTPQHLFIGDKVESIAGYMFNYYGEHPDTVTCYAVTPPGIAAYCFTNETYNNALLEVPAESLEAYCNAEGWKEFYNIVAICEVTIPGDVDGDGVVGISDVTTLINYLLSGNASSVNETNADCDGNGKITIDDVTTLINYLLSGKW